MSIFLTARELIVADALHDPVRMRLVGSPDRAVIEGRGELPGLTHYYRGNDPERWIENVPSYTSAVVRDAYPGVDVVYYQRGEHLEFDFVVAPGADPGQIILQFTGASPRIDERGDLLLRSDRSLRLSKPVAYQEIGGVRQDVNAQFLRRENSFGFALGTYDETHPLVIDPILLFGTYLGGSSSDFPRDLAVNRDGFTAVAGVTDSPDFPASDDSVRRGNYDYFVTKYDPAGNLVFSTILGSSGTNGEILAAGVDIDPQGNVYLGGTTDGTDYPTVNALYPTCPGCPEDSGVVTKLGPAGSIVYSTYLGANGDTEIQDVAVTSSGELYVYGITAEGSPEQRLGFPLVNAYQSASLTTGNGCCARSLFLTRFNASGSGILYSTLYGSDTSSVMVLPAAVAVDGNGDAWISGNARIESQPMYPGGFTFVTTPGAIRTSAQADGNTSTDAFVVRFDTDATGDASLIYATLLGGDSGNDDLGLRAGPKGSDAIAVDSQGNAFVIGTTYSTDFPTTAGVIGPVLTGGNTTDWFLSKIAPDGTDLVYSTYFGSPNGGSDTGLGISVDSNGNALVSGTMVSGVTPVHPLFGQEQSPSGVPGFVASINPTATGVNFASYLDIDEAVAIGTDKCGNLFVLGVSSTFTSESLVKNAAQEASAGGTDSFVLRIDTINGDSNHDCAVNVADIFYLINHLFAGGPEPIGAVDANGDRSVNVADIFYLINYLFAGGPLPVSD